MKLFLPAILILVAWLPASNAALPTDVTQAIDQWMATDDPVVEDDWPVYQRALLSLEDLEPVRANFVPERMLALGGCWRS